MAPIVWLALVYEGTLIQLLKIKFELLIQCVPAFYLGVHCRWLTARTVTLGVLAGLAVTLVLVGTQHPSVWGFHSGVLGLAVNFFVCFSDYFCHRRSFADEKRVCWYYASQYQNLLMVPAFFHDRPTSIGIPQVRRKRSQQPERRKLPRRFAQTRSSYP